MKLILFLSVLSVFTLAHICKAIPLRLHKRAVFYIANETACVVDDIVYSNGEPIPTEDPCESCKCRPPGFACVLKDCKIKPGCRAIRRLGECCPDYVCDVPDNIPPSQGNALPTINLLPALNDESILLEELPLTSKAPEEPLDLTQPPQLSDNIDEKDSLEETPAEISSEPLPSETETFGTEEDRLDFKNENTDSEVKETSNNDKLINLAEENDGDNEATKTENETKILFNSEANINEEDNAETNINEDDNVETASIKDDSSQPIEDVDIKGPQIPVINEDQIIEKSPEVESTSTDIPVNDEIKNSASENSKSLKLSDDEQSKDPEKEEEKQPDELEKTNQEESETISEASSETQTLNSRESSTDTTVTETQTSPLPISLHSSNEKIKPESIETVTIVVHVNEKPALTTETDFIDENTTQQSKDETQENLLKSNDELGTSAGNDESSTIVKTESTGKNFEIFPTTELSDGTTTKFSSDDLKSEVQARSDESDSITSEAGKDTENEDASSDTKDEEDSSVTASSQNVSDDTKDEEDSSVTTSSQNVSDDTKDEDLQENKITNPTVTLIKIDPNGSVRIEIATESKDETQKPEEPTAKSSIEETTSEETKLDEVMGEVTSETQPEAREAESEQTTNEEKSTSIENIQESTTIQNIEQPAGNTDPSTALENVQSSTQAGDLPEERAEETEVPKTTGITETAGTDEITPEEISKSQDQETEAPKESD